MRCRRGAAASARGASNPHHPAPCDPLALPPDRRLLWRPGGARGDGRGGGRGLQQSAGRVRPHLVRSGKGALRRRRRRGVAVAVRCHSLGPAAAAATAAPTPWQPRRDGRAAQSRQEARLPTHGRLHRVHVRPALPHVCAQQAAGSTGWWCRAAATAGSSREQGALGGPALQLRGPCRQAQLLLHRPALPPPSIAAAAVPLLFRRRRRCHCACLWAHIKAIYYAATYADVMEYGK